MLEYDEAVAAAGDSRENQEYRYRKAIGGHVKRYSIPMLIITIFGIGTGVASLFFIGSEDENGWSMGFYNAALSMLMASGDPSLVLLER